MKIVARFEIPFYQFLDEHFILADNTPDFLQHSNYLIKLYRLMVLSRVFDTKAITLQRTGKIGTYPSSKGQEAVFVGIGAAMQPDDIYVPYYRDTPALLQRGVKLSDILLYWGGDERGNNFANSDTNFPYSVPIGTQVLHATGAAYALKFRRQKRAVLSVCGDGGTSEGDFYEAMNVAGVWHLPIVFVINNNQWAISMPRHAQTHSTTLAQKAIAAGFAGEQVDGNDVLAVCERVQKALQKAREKSQPTLIEMICYRQSDHTTADDRTRYEPKNIREAEWIKEPVARLRHYLEKIAVWDEAKEIALQKECIQQVEQAVEEYLNVSMPAPTNMFDHLYAILPKAYIPERAQLEEVGKS